MNAMIKVSAGYNRINPNFIIQNLDEPDEWAHPVFAILKNILMRGCPTLPSLHLREQFGAPKINSAFSYRYDFSLQNWSGVIKGGDSNPALKFYEKILPQLVSLPGSFLPECPVRDILPDSNLSGQVDFYSPVYGAVIEIDGGQHTENEQRNKDKLRDDLFKRHGIATIRIPVAELSDLEKLSEKFRDIEPKVKADTTSFNQNELAYPLAIRLEILLLYLYGTRKIGLEQKALDLNLYADFPVKEKTLRTISDDFFLWTKNLTELYNLPFSVPKVEWKIFGDCEAFRKSVGIKIDISLTKTYGIAKSDDIFYLRNDYFPYETYDDGGETLGKNYFRVAYSEVHYALEAKKHEKNLLFFLRNCSDRYGDFRANQLEIILELLNNRSVIGILPTGAGKSLCYQISALLIPAMTVVVAPLKVLMEDQYEHLRQNLGLNHSTFINSSYIDHLSLFSKGQSLITLISPERFFSERFSKAFSALHVGFIVIDEAHCLSEWGHDFRTSYLCLSHNLGTLLPPDTFLMALTGTASHSVFRDIENEFYYLKQRATRSIFADDMRRPNLALHVQKFEDDAEKQRSYAEKQRSYADFFESLKKDDKKGPESFKLQLDSMPDFFAALCKEILPTLTGFDRQKTLVFTKTKTAGAKDPTASACISLCAVFSAVASRFGKKNIVGYFAGGNELNDRKKDEILSAFQNDTDLKVLFATKAFGMGIDIPDIRKTIHYGLPSSMESLYQQIGRAGRDGKKSDCYILFRKERKEDYDLFFSPERLSIDTISKNERRLRELGTNFYFIQNANLDVEVEQKVVTRVLGGIRRINSRGKREINCETICRAILTEMKDDKHLLGVLGRYEITKEESETIFSETSFPNYDTVERGLDYQDIHYKFMGNDIGEDGKTVFTEYEKIVTDYEFRPSPNASIIIERALYRLYLLGEIEMWTVVYGPDVVNPTFANLKTTDYTDEQKFGRLVKHIERYETRASAMPKEKTFEARLNKLLSWSYDNFVLERIKSMKTLYDWCIDFTDSNNFMRRLAEYFSNDPVYARLTGDSVSVADLIAALRRNPPETKLRIARLLESYERKDFLNYLSGITRLRLGEFSDFDGERRLDMALEGIKLLPERDRLALFFATYDCIEEDRAKEIFAEKWMRYSISDARNIYDATKSETAEAYILTDFVQKFLEIKEKIDVKLRKNG